MVVGQDFRRRIAAPTVAEEQYGQPVQSPVVFDAGQRRVQIQHGLGQAHRVLSLGRAGAGGVVGKDPVAPVHEPQGLRQVAFRRAAKTVGDDDESFVVVLAVDPAGQQVFAGEEADFPPGIRLLHLLIERKRAGRLRFNAHKQERINNVRGRDGTGDVHHKQNQKENFQFLFHGACSFFKKIAQ